MTHHLAQLNIGRLQAEPNDPLVRDFMVSIDRVNGIGKRMPGFVWMMEGSGAPNTGNTQTSVDGDPRFVSNLTIWETVEAMEAFVWTTVHRQFYSRRAEWFEVLGKMHFVMWWIEVGYRPTLEEGLERLAHLEIHGDSEHAFGWRHLPQARLWRDRSCGAEPGKRASACRDDLSGK